jgi:hypothetical protein
LTALAPTAQWEGAGESWPIYMRGLAHLRAGAASSARTEFLKVLGHRGRTFWSPLYPLAHLGLARAAAIGGDRAAADRAYRDFFALWKDADADPDLPVMIEAKREHERLGSR